MTFTFKELVLESCLVTNVIPSSVFWERLQCSHSARPPRPNPARVQPQEYLEHGVVHLCDVEEVSCSSHVNRHGIFVCRIARRDFKVQEHRQSLHCLLKNWAHTSWGHLELQFYPRRWELYFTTVKKAYSKKWLISPNTLRWQLNNPCYVLLLVNSSGLAE